MAIKKLLLTIGIYFSMYTICQATDRTITNSDFSFLAISDLHVKNDGPGQQYPKFTAIKNFISNTQNNTRAILMPGDLTDGATNKQASNFDKYWFTPLEDAMQKTNGHVYACLGNHDKPSSSRNNIVDFVRNNCGDPYFYSFNIGDIHFACCYLHPGHWDISLLFGFSPLNLINSYILLEADLLLHHDKKIVLFWHFDIKGAFSDWWTNTEKNIAYHLIKDYNILHLFVGHSHTPQFTTYWEGKANERKIPVSLVGGDYFAFCSYVNKTLQVNFMNSGGNIKTWQDMYKSKKQIMALKKTPKPKSRNLN